MKFEPFDGLVQNAVGLVGVISPATLQDGAGIADFCCDEPLREEEGGVRVVRSPILGAPEQHVSRNRAFNPREEAPGFIQERNRDSLLCACSKDGRRAAEVSEHDDPLEQMERQLQRLLAIHAHY